MKKAGKPKEGTANSRSIIAKVKNMTKAKETGKDCGKLKSIPSLFVFNKEKQET
jgi:hypothetical protein